MFYVRLPQKIRRLGIIVCLDDTTALQVLGFIPIPYIGTHLHRSKRGVTNTGLARKCFKRDKNIVRNINCNGMEGSGTDTASET
jgi:hypothetical protein